MTIGSPRFFSGFTALELMARRRYAGQRKSLVKKVLCTALSIALLNTSLSPVYAVHAHPQANDAVSSSDQVSQVRTKSSKAEKKLSKKAAQGISQEMLETIVETQKSTQKSTQMGYVSWLFEGVKGLASLTSRAVTYVLKNPAEALVIGLASQVAATNALSPLTDDFLVNQNTDGNRNSPALAALSNGNAFVAWNSDQTENWDVYQRVFAPNGTPLSNEFTLVGIQYDPTLAALSDGNVFVAWQGEQTTGDMNVYGRRVFANGTGPLSSEFILNQNTAGSQKSPALAALSDGNAFVVWQGDQTEDWDIYGRVFAPNGMPLSSEFTLNRVTCGFQAYPALAALGNGNAFVVWSGNQAGGYFDIYGRVFAPNGTALSDEFTLNQNTISHQINPALAALSDGNAFVVWQSNQAGMGNSNVYGRVFAPNGRALSDEFTLNKNTTGEQIDPDLAVLSDGNVFVVWLGGTVQDSDVYGRVFAPNGMAVSDEFILNQNTADSQKSPALAALSDGNAFVVWEGTGQDIYGRVFGFSDPK
jgi:hypothetical protein